VGIGAGLLTGGTAAPVGVAIGAGVGGAVMGYATDKILGIVERRLMRWSGYEMQ